MNREDQSYRNESGETYRIDQLSRGPANHFFGYYGMSPWDKTLNNHIALETTFQDHRPNHKDFAYTGVIDIQTGQFIRHGRTSAFNLQQGSMMHWIDAGFGEEFTYNDWLGEQLVSRAVNPVSKCVRTIDGAIAAVSPESKAAIGLNFKRMAGCRAVVGYASEDGYQVTEDKPKDDGLFLLDLVSGRSKLLLSIDEVVRANPMKQTKEGPAWFNHVFFSPNGNRMLFLCRVKRDVKWYSSLWLVGIDGHGLRCLIDYRYRISHFYWRDNKHIVVSTDYPDGEMRFIEIKDGEDGFRLFGDGALPNDGHISFSPNGEWVVCDTYPIGPERLSELILFNDTMKKKVLLGKFHSDMMYTGDIRCDLHPRWRPDGKVISFDSVHEGSRQIYTIHVADIIDSVCNKEYRRIGL